MVGLDGPCKPLSLQMGKMLRMACKRPLLLLCTMILPNHTELLLCLLTNLEDSSSTPTQEMDAMTTLSLNA